MSAQTPVTDKNTKEVPSAFTLIGQTIDVVKKNPVPFLFLVILPAILADPWSSSIYKIDVETAKSFADLKFVADAAVSDTAKLLVFIAFIFSLMAQGGTVLAVLKSLQGKTVDAISAFKEGLKYAWRLIGLSILSGIILFLSILLLIVPFFLVLPRIILAPAFLVDQNLRVVESLRASWNQTRGNTRYIWGYIGVLLLVSLGLSILDNIPVIGLLALFAASLLSAISPIIRYRQLQIAKIFKNS